MVNKFEKLTKEEFIKIIINYIQSKYEDTLATMTNEIKEDIISGASEINISMHLSIAETIAENQFITALTRQYIEEAAPNKHIYPKEDFIKTYTTGKFEKADKNVIQFIADINWKDENAHDLFANEYCYYFAIMLQKAFNRGNICWHRNYGHIVWEDTTGIAYDVDGVFTDYNEGDLLPVDESLEDLIVDFKHNGETYSSGSKLFSDWASHYKMTDIEAIGKIYMMMPKEDINDDISVTQNVLLYFMAHEKELSLKFEELKHERGSDENKKRY